MMQFLIHEFSSFLLAASVAGIAADNPDGKKTILARDVSALFINGKPAVINGLRKFKGSLS